MKSTAPVMLIILDGWGINPSQDANAVSIARTPFLDKLKTEYPSTQLTCSGEAVGLPAGIMGNSEVGHLNIGAGRIVYQDLLRIDLAINIDVAFVIVNADSQCCVDHVLDVHVVDHAAAVHVECVQGTIHYGGLDNQRDVGIVNGAVAIDVRVDIAGIEAQRLSPHVE